MGSPTQCLKSRPFGSGPGRLGLKIPPGRAKILPGRAENSPGRAESQKNKFDVK